MASIPAGQFFEPWEPEPIDSWPAFQESINALTDRYSHNRLVWRGARDADWGVQSSLYRSLGNVLGHQPDEDEMVAAEKQILKRARTDWRFDGMPALELFALLQHFGGPTRLLDVSENPLVALWFATEAPTANESDLEADGRLLAFVAPREKDIQLNRNWHGRDPLWHDLRNDQRRASEKWGTGLGRRYWRPPTYHSRIASQSAGFLLDGVPVEAARSDFAIHAPEERTRWTAMDLREFSSIPLRLTKARAGQLSAEASPVFTFRVVQEAKAEIRNQLESRFALSASTVYADMFGFGQYLAHRPEELLG